MPNTTETPALFSKATLLWIRRRLCRWLDPDTHDDEGLAECLRLGLDAMTAKYGHSSHEVANVLWMIDELERKEKP